MQKDSLTTCITKAVASKSSAMRLEKEKKLIKILKDMMNEEFESFEKCSAIDIKNNNGEKLDLDRINALIDRLLEEEILFYEKDKISKGEELVKSTLYYPKGVIGVLFDGNFYTMLELIIKSIYTHNAIFFLDDGYMLGTNDLLIQLVGDILGKNGYDRNIIGHYYGDDFKEVYSNFKSINKVIVIGNSEFCDKYRKLLSGEVQISGYNYYDLYIEDLLDMELLKNILLLGKNMNLYIKDNLNVKSSEAIFVSDIDEAITMINYNGALYSSSIFSKDTDSVSKFLKNVNSKNIFVNTSPTLISELDITQSDLLIEKNIYVPNQIKTAPKK